MGNLLNKKPVDDEASQLRKAEVEAVRKVVKQMLSDPDIDTFIPNAIEGKIYEHLLILVFAHLKSTLNSSKIQFLEHEITFTIKPITKSETVTNEI